MKRLPPYILEGITKEDRLLSNAAEMLALLNSAIQGRGHVPENWNVWLRKVRAIVHKIEGVSAERTEDANATH